jgi:hypothetical protein
MIPKIPGSPAKSSAKEHYQTRLPLFSAGLLAARERDWDTVPDAFQG